MGVAPVAWRGDSAYASAREICFSTPIPCPALIQARLHAAQTLRGEHLARCIGRLAGKSGKTKFTIENATRTRITLADTKIHILGSTQNIRAARDALCALILGSPAGKVATRLRTVSARLNNVY